MKELFRSEKTLSPSEKWRKKNKIEISEKNGIFIARKNQKIKRSKSREEALLGLADELGIECWKAKELKKWKKRQ